MDQSEIDALLKGASGSKPKTGEPPPAPKAQSEAKESPAPVQPKAEGPELARSKEGHLIQEIDAVTAVTERETNKVMDQLDVISQLVGKQQELITKLMSQGSAQDPAVQEALHNIMTSGKNIQDKVYEAMDLMQFQDITRQKLERIVFHLRQIHDYIIDLLGTGFKNDDRPMSISRTIAQTGTTPDEKKELADSVIREFQQSKKKE